MSLLYIFYANTKNIGIWIIYILYWIIKSNLKFDGSQNTIFSSYPLLVKYVQSLASAPFAWACTRLNQSG